MQLILLGIKKAFIKQISEGDREDVKHKKIANSIQKVEWKTCRDNFQCRRMMNMSLIHCLLPSSLSLCSVTQLCWFYISFLTFLALDCYLISVPPPPPALIYQCCCRTGLQTQPTLVCASKFLHWWLIYKFTLQKLN